MSVLRISFVLLSFIASVCVHAQSCFTGNSNHYNFDDVKRILDNNQCNSCHYTNSNRSSWDYNKYANLFALNTCGYQIITPGKSASSSLIDKLNGGPTSCGFPMPLGRQPISNQELLAIESWINVGAPENCVLAYSDIRHILDQKKCNSCHNDTRMWSYETYESMFLKPQNSLCQEINIVKYDASNSLLYIKLNHANYCGSTTLSSENQLDKKEIATIRDWINAGAPNQKGSLPVQLSSFTTRNNENTSITIFWTTESEQNTSHFDLEHSMDGITYQTIAVVHTQGLSNGLKYYSYRHDGILVGFNYYRLNFIDFDQSAHYSPVRIERVKNTQEIFNVSPNPITQLGELKVEWYPIDQRIKSQVTICNFLGYEVKRVNINFGINTINTAELIPGLYYLTIQDYSEGIVSTKLVVL